MSDNLKKLKLLPAREYKGGNQDEPTRFYFLPVVGSMYRRRVELCLAECVGGTRILEVGFGTGVSFLNLHEIYQEIHGLDLTVNVDDVKKVFDRLGVPTFLRNGNVLNMPYENDTFDTVLLISVLEHLKPSELDPAFREIHRILKTGGQMVYGVPIERTFMVALFYLLGYNIRKAHFSTEIQISTAAEEMFHQKKITRMKPIPSIIGPVYEVGNFEKN